MISTSRMIGWAKVDEDLVSSEVTEEGETKAVFVVADGALSVSRISAR